MKRAANARKVPARTGKPARKRKRLYEALPAEEAGDSRPAKTPGAPGLPGGTEGQVSAKDREAKAGELVRKYMLWSMGFSLVPIPVADTIAVAGVQLKMLGAISALYRIPFSENRAKSIIAALGGGVVSISIANNVAWYSLHFIPLVGMALRLFAAPVLAGAFTHAIGKVFIHHYELGGTLLDFSPKKSKAYFAEEFRKGRLAAERLAKGKR
ncbi:YcjF family protein [Elusimicrobiota bacterium]